MLLATKILCIQNLYCKEKGFPCTKEIYIQQSRTFKEDFACIGELVNISCILIGKVILYLYPHS